MKKRLHSLLTAGTLFFLLHGPALAIAGQPPLPDNPTEVLRKAAREKVTAAKKAATLKRSSHRKSKFTAKLAYNMRVMLGLEESKAVTSPAKLNRQLHRIQNQLKLRARVVSRARKRRVHKQAQP